MVPVVEDIFSVPPLAMLVAPLTLNVNAPISRVPVVTVSVPPKVVVPVSVTPPDVFAISILL